MSLIITYAPRDDESGIGYYRRLAADNAFFSWRHLTDTAGVDRSRSALLMSVGEVASNLGLETIWAESAREKEDHCRGWGRLHRTQSDAVCPACLAESPHLRHSWEHAYVTACIQHTLQLVDQCEACGENLSPERLYIGLCSCGHDLSSLAQVPASPAQLWLSALIATNGRQPNKIEPVFKSLDINVLVKVIQTLCLQPDPKRPALPRRVAIPKSVAEAADFLAPLEALLADWPTGFETHVKDRIAAGRKDARTLNTLLGSWYIGLRKLCKGTALESLVEVVIEVAAANSDCVLGLDSVKAMAEDVTGYMRAPDVAKALGVSVSRLHDSIHAGECEYRTRRMGTRGQLFEIPRSEVERIQKQRARWVSDANACELAGVSPALLDRMKAAGIINSDTRWREDLLKGGPVEQHSMIELYGRVSTWAQLRAVTNDATLTWAKLTSRRMGEKHAIESLLKAIAKGEVKAVAQARLLGEMSFLRSDVSRYFGAPLIEAGMSIQQLAQATSWKWESISHWVDQGLLGSESTLRRGQVCRVVLPQHLLAFRQRYIPLAELAKAMGTKASALSQSLPGIESVGAKCLADGATRGALIRIADLGRLAILGAKAGRDLFVPAS